MAALTTVTRMAAAGPGAWFRDLIRAESIKFRGTRSTYYSLLALVVVGVGVSALVGQGMAARWPHLTAEQRAGFDPLRTTFRGFEIGQLIIGALGVLMISSEYSSGLIRTTFAAIPQRRSVLMAKAIVMGITALVVAEAAAFSAFFIAQALLEPTGMSLSVGSPGALGAVSSMGLYLGVVALLGLALGALLRHTAGAIAALFALVFLLPGVVSALPSPWDDRIGEWLPDNLAGQLVSLRPNPDYLPRTTSLALLLAYPAVFLVAAAWRLGRSDA
jgi:ABC-2 type transport system permease protein